MADKNASNFTSQKESFIVFADDWGRHPSSCQHLFKVIMRDYPVVWVNTIGLRPPRLDFYTFKRGVEKLQQWLERNGGGRAGKWLSSPIDGPRVVSPVMWPRLRKRWEQALNRHLLRRQLNRVIQNFSRPRIVVTTIPTPIIAMRMLDVDKWVYYCVDDFRHWPELDRTVIEQLEQKLITYSDIIIAANEQLRKRIEERGKQASVVTHGIDWNDWQRAPQALEAAPISAWLRHYERPWVVFWGSVNWQIDAKILESICNRLNSGTVLLVGPVDNCDLRLKKVPRVKMPGAVPYHWLRVLARYADVLVMPYRTGPGVEESEPLKLLEYLATDRPVVVCDIPATRRWKDALDIAETPEQFANYVIMRLQTGAPTSQLEARKRVARESWDEKAQQFLEIVLAPE